MNEHQLEIYAAIISATIIGVTIYRKRKKISEFAVQKTQEMQSNQIIEEEITQLENQIEKTNKNLILIDNNIQNISVAIKKLIRSYKSKEQDLKEKLSQDKERAKIVLFEKYQRQLFMDIVELAGAEIINDNENKNKFLSVFLNTNLLPKYKK